MSPMTRGPFLPRISTPMMLLVGATLWWPPDADAARMVTLREALSLAGEHSPVLSASRYEVEAADAQRTVARAAYLPKLEASEAWAHTNNPSLVFGTLLNQGRFTDADFNTAKLNVQPRGELRAQ